MAHRNIPMTIGGAAVLACAFLVCASGCAVGRRETDGAIVLGFEAGKLAETPGQLASIATDFLPEPWGSLGKAALGAVGVGGLVAAGGQKRTRQESDAAYEEGRAAANAARDAADRAYDEAKIREAYKRASPDSFTVVPPPATGGGGPVPAQ
jgi:hypothetical protein